MEKYNIKIFSAAKKDLMDIVEYINTLSREAAIKQYDGIIQKISTLTQMPERCSMVKDNNLKLKGYRVLIVDNYLVFFVVKSSTVQIRRILYARRDYSWLL